MQAAQVADIRFLKPETARKRKRTGNTASEAPQQRQLATATDNQVQAFLKRVKVSCLNTSMFWLAGVLKPTLDNVKAAKRAKNLVVIINTKNQTNKISLKSMSCPSIGTRV